MDDFSLEIWYNNFNKLILERNMYDYTQVKKRL